MEVHNHARAQRKKTTHTSTPTFYRPYSTWEKKIKTRNKLVIQSPLIIKFCSAWDKVRHGGREGKPPAAICKHGEKDGCRLIIDSTQPHASLSSTCCSHGARQLFRYGNQWVANLCIILLKPLTIWASCVTPCLSVRLGTNEESKKKKIWKIHLGIDESSLG